MRLGARMSKLKRGRKVILTSNAFTAHVDPVALYYTGEYIDLRDMYTVGYVDKKNGTATIWSDRLPIGLRLHETHLIPIGRK